MKSESELPHGFKFDSREQEEDILKYLEKKAKGEPLPPYEIPQVNLYGDVEPSELFNRAKTSGEPIFVLTKLTNKTTKRMLRTCGSGKWDGRTKATGVYAKRSGSDGRKILLGFKKLFTFASRSDDDSDRQDRNNGHLNMVEYSLPDDKAASNFVICKIQSKNCRAGTLQKNTTKSATNNNQVNINGLMEEDAKSSAIAKTSKRTINQANQDDINNKLMFDNGFNWEDLRSSSDSASNHKRVRSSSDSASNHKRVRTTCSTNHQEGQWSNRIILDAGEFLYHGPGIQCTHECFLPDPAEEDPNGDEEEALGREWDNAPPYAHKLAVFLLGNNKPK